MRAQEETFVSGAVARGMTEKVAGRLFQLIGKFAGYGFNKAHATGYAVLAYRTAYLKARYPAEFFAALITHEMRDANRIDTYRQELARRGIPLLPPRYEPLGPRLPRGNSRGLVGGPVGDLVGGPGSRCTERGRHGRHGRKRGVWRPTRKLPGRARRCATASPPCAMSAKLWPPPSRKEREAGGPFASLEDFAGRMHEAARRAAAEEAQSALSGVGGGGKQRTGRRRGPPPQQARP